MIPTAVPTAVPTACQMLTRHLASVVSRLVCHCPSKTTKKGRQPLDQSMVLGEADPGCQVVQTIHNPCWGSTPLQQASAERALGRGRTPLPWVRKVEKAFLEVLSRQRRCMIGEGPHCGSPALLCLLTKLFFKYVFS